MDAMEFLRRISGHWTGTGKGQYPTIDSYSYREDLTLSFHREYPLLRYEQRTWLLSDQSASHWELGFWRGLDDGRVEISNA